MTSKRHDLSFRAIGKLLSRQICEDVLCHRRIQKSETLMRKVLELDQLPAVSMTDLRHDFEAATVVRKYEAFIERRGAQGISCMSDVMFDEMSAFPAQAILNQRGMRQ